MKTFFNFFLTKAESGENKKILTKKRGGTYLLKPEKLSKKRSKIKKISQISTNFILHTLIKYG